jgi:hypothetical protein
MKNLCGYTSIIIALKVHLFKNYHNQNIMTYFALLVSLLPLVFIFHDLEEIIFFKRWINKNSDYLALRFPKLSTKILPHFQNTSTAGFALAVAEELLVLSAITYLSIFFDNYYFWFAAFMAFSIHIVVHLAQWLIVRKYIPVIVSSVLATPYCIITFLFVVNNNLLSVSQMVSSTFIGLILMALNLIFALKLAAKFDSVH